jgi:hypothetical protein
LLVLVREWVLDRFQVGVDRDGRHAIGDALSDLLEQRCTVQSPGTSTWNDATGACARRERARWRQPSSPCSR